MRRLTTLIAGVVLLGTATLGAIGWFTFRVYVPENMCAVLIKKTGDMLPNDESVATSEDQRGIQQEALGPGRHFRDPIRWDWELVKLTEIPSGDPSTWRLTQSGRPGSRSDQFRSGQFTYEGDFPKVGVVTRKVGKKAPAGQLIVSRESGYQGILREVLTPGTYKINPYVYDVEVYPAVVIPAGFVGVVTNLFANDEVVASATDAPAAPRKSLPESRSAYSSRVRPLAEPGERGTLRAVLQPGIYFINPKMKKVTLVEIGYNEFSQLQARGAEDSQISFPSDTGYLIRVGVTVVWGIDPAHAAEIINEYGNVDSVLEKVIRPQLRSICRNIGSTYAARDFIQGEKRELFQLAMTAELQRVCRTKNIEVLLALVREIEVQAPSAGDAEADAGADAPITEDLKRTIQQSHIAIENRLTKEKQREAATVRAQLEEVKKKVDIARETIKADSRIMVANIQANGEKEAAEIDAKAGLAVATIQEEVARLEAQRTEILGQAGADVEKMKNAAEAEGYQMLVNAFGSPQAYNLFTFAEGFQPREIRLFFAGEGTFWTDLTRFEELGAAKLLQRTEPAAPLRETAPDARRSPSR